MMRLGVCMYTYYLGIMAIMESMIELRRVHRNSRYMPPGLYIENNNVRARLLRKAKTKSSVD